jgi:hypothetical protein
MLPLAHTEPFFWSVYAVASADADANDDDDDGVVTKRRVVVLSSRAHDIVDRIFFCVLFFGTREGNMR